MSDGVLVWAYVISAVISDMAVVGFLSMGEAEKARGMLIPATVVTFIAVMLLIGLEHYRRSKREWEHDMQVKELALQAEKAKAAEGKETR